MTNPAREHLLPCPFCGGGAEIIECIDASYYAMCSSVRCGGQTPCGKTKDEAAILWNTRAKAKAAPQAEPVAYADQKAFENFQAGICSKEWMWALPDSGLVPLYTAAAKPDAELVELLRDAVELIKRGYFDTGYCCCGGAIDKHGMEDGHSPVDQGDYCAMQTIGRIYAKLAELSHAK